jgi:nucleoside-diphosphate-sugar epimerase
MSQAIQDVDFTWAGKRVLVSGATGFIGAGVAQRLIELDAQVVAITRSRPPSDSVEWIPLAGNEPFPRDAVLGFNPDFVFHLATRFKSSHSFDDIEELVRSNIEFGTKLLESAKHCEAIFVNINSSWQHYDSKPYSPVSLYAATKQAFADIAQYYGETGLDLRSLTIYDTFGPADQRNKLIQQLLEAIKRNTQVDMGEGSQLINLLFLSDVVSAIVRIAELPKASHSQEFVARAKESVSVRELVAVIESLTGGKLNVNWGAREARPREMTSDWVFGELLPGWDQEVDLIEGLKICWRENNGAT